MEAVDLGSVPMDEVFKTLLCDTKGLSKEAAEQRIAIFGPNKLVVKQGKPPEWQDFVGIILLLLINSTIGFFEETKAENATAALMVHLAPKTKSALTGESLLVTKRYGDYVYSGTTCKQGEVEALVVATGVHTSFGNAASKSCSTNQEVGRIQKVFVENVQPDVVVLLAARASQVENQDAIDAAIIGMLEDPEEARAGIEVVDFLNPTDKRTEITYIQGNEGKMYRVSKGAPEQILNLVDNKPEIEDRVHLAIDNFAERGFRSLAVAYQEVPEGTEESPGDPWRFVALMPLFDLPRHDSADTIKSALDLGVNVKMITGDQLAIAKGTGRHLGMGTNMYPASELLDDSISALSVEEFIENADGFAGAFPEHKYQIVKRLQDRRHICGMIGDGVDDAPALKKADIGIAVAESTEAARGASDIVLTEPGLSVIISAIRTSRSIFQRMKNYTIYAVSITVRIVILTCSSFVCNEVIIHSSDSQQNLSSPLILLQQLAFSLLALIWHFDFPPFMILIIAILNDGTVMTISKDRVKLSPHPDHWKLAEIFTTGIILGGYLAMVTVLFFWTAYDTSFFPRIFKVPSLYKNDVKDFRMLASAVYLQVSTISQALIFVTRSRGWSCAERPGVLLMAAFVVTQTIATLIAVYANWGFAYIEGIGWRWAGLIWAFNFIFYIPLDPLKFLVRYTLSGGTKNIDREDSELRWSHALRIIHGLDPPETVSQSIPKLTIQNSYKRL
ncbi:unnamed protein product [Thlaspi arvense]|uniref:P-type H(+)-exporting transporter n=1 Tax=Thlaspi arvense TaxID=13288 RepID=A0AAU9TAH6_THLAR|nr:unnamed protein product [Thlaspi arvense]